MRISHAQPFILFALIAAAGCANTTLARFSTSEDVPETRVQGAGLINALPLTLSTLKLDVSSTEAYQNADYDYVTEIKLSGLSFDITASSTDHNTDSFEDGVDDNFDFIEGMELHIQATFDGAEHKTRIAYLDEQDAQVGSSTQHLVLSTDSVDILDYVEAADGYEIIVSATGSVPPDDVIFDGTAIYKVGIGFN